MKGTSDGARLSDDVVRMARKRGIAGMVCGVVLVVMGIAPFATALTVDQPALAGIAAAFAMIGVLTGVVAQVALSIARHYPVIPPVIAVNTVGTVLIIVAALAGAAAIALLDRTFIYYPLILSLVVLGFYMSAIGRANRKVLLHEALEVETGA